MEENEDENLLQQVYTIDQELVEFLVDL